MYDDEAYADDIEEESPPPAADHTARLNHASGVFRIKESRAEVREKFKKSPWWSKVLCCQNIDIRHGQHELYMGQRQIRKDIKASRGEPDVLSDKTLSYNTWSKGRVNWADFEDISSAPSSSSARPHGKSAAAQIGRASCRERV